MQRHSLKVGCDVEDYAEDNVEEEMAEVKGMGDILYYSCQGIFFVL